MDDVWKILQNDSGFQYTNGEPIPLDVYNIMIKVQKEFKDAGKANTAKPDFNSP